MDARGAGVGPPESVPWLQGTGCSAATPSKPRNSNGIYRKSVASEEWQFYFLTPNSLTGALLLGPGVRMGLAHVAKQPVVERWLAAIEPFQPML